MGSLRKLTDYAGLVLVIVLLVAVFGLTTDHFLTRATFINIANQIPHTMVVAVGMTFVLIIGGIDLSVGSVLSLSGAVLAVAMKQYDCPLLVALGLGLGAGLACGLVNGLVVVTWRLPSFIVTLGMLEAARGLTYLLTPTSVYVGDEVEVVSQIGLFDVSLLFVIAVAVVIIGQVALSHTKLGRHLLALGANAESARLSGIRTRRLTVVVFALSGLLAAAAGLIQCARFGTSDPNAGIGFELEAIAAVVIGGTSLMGGRGSVINSFFGVLIIAVLGVGLFAVGAQESTKRLVTGCVIVAAVILDYYRHRLKAAA